MLKEWKQKFPKKLWKTFYPRLQKRINRKSWIDKLTEFAGAFKKFCAAEGIQDYSTLSETQAAFAKHTLRSLKNILYHYMEDYGYRYIHKRPQFITTSNSTRNNMIDMRPNTVKNCDFMSVPYSEHLGEYKKPTFKIGDRVRISKVLLAFSQRLKATVYTRSLWNCSNWN